jgi:hypothetical protein
MGFFYRRQAELIAAFNKRVSPVRGFVRLGGPPMLETAKGTISILPVDYLYWSPPLEALASGAGRSGQKWVHRQGERDGHGKARCARLDGRTKGRREARIVCAPSEHHPLCAAARLLDSSPNLTPAEDRQSKIAPNRELLAVGAKTHLCLVDVPSLRIEYRASVIVESGLLHPLNENQAKERLIVLVAWTVCANWIRVVTRIDKQSRETPYKDVPFVSYGDKCPHFPRFINLSPDAVGGRSVRAGLGCR